MAGSPEGGQEPVPVLVPDPHIPSAGGDPTEGALRAGVLELAISRLEALERTHLPRWEVPRVFGGHRVGGDVAADLLYTLGLLGAAGVTRVAGTPVDDAITRVLAQIEGDRTHTFFSYRVAETVARAGRFAGNPLLDDLTARQREEVERACDSTTWIPLLDAGLPRNYAAVLARCEAGRAALDLDVDPTVLDELVGRVEALLTSNPYGYLDDSEDGQGARYDIYTADLYLFCEPLAPRLGDTWREGMTGALDLVSHVVAHNGAAVVWGRSTGALALCLTVELAAIAVTSDGPARARWLGLGARAAHALERWFDPATGVIRAHQHRSTYRYRGPARRLQMTLDCLGKLAWAAARLPASASLPDVTEPLFPSRDEVLRFDPETTAGVWTFRSDRNAFVLPLVGPIHSDYQPSPHAPALYEQPVDSPLATWIPTAFVGDTAFVAGGLPSRVDHAPGRLEARYEQLRETTSDGSVGRALRCERTVTHRVLGRALQIDERLHFPDEVPDAISLSIPEPAGRPLLVGFHTEHPHRSRVVDTAGMKEWRSFWGELPRVHEVELQPASELAWTTTITPVWRVASSISYHHYHQSLYGAIGERAVVRAFARHHLDRTDEGAERLEHVDLFHVHWPEWFFDTDVAAAERFCDLLDREEVRMIWTQHNLVPHAGDDPRFDALYRTLAARAAGVIHHSEWGRQRCLARYDYDPAAVHAVVPHGHFGNLMTSAVDRAAAERELGLPPLPNGGLRIGVVGAPRSDKQVASFMEAFAATERDDLQLVVLSLAGEAVPEDPRITALPYEFVDRDTYNRRLTTIDLLALPFGDGGRMLTTGVVGDAVGLGIAALVSSWPYLAEALGAAGLPIGDSVAEMASAIEQLTPEAVAAGAAAAGMLQDASSWERAAELTLELFEVVGTARV